MAGVSLATGVSAIDSINLSTANITGVLPGVNGGTGAANTGKVITLANNLTTVGNFAMTLTATATSNATLPAGTKTLAATDGTGASGTWGIDISGNAATATSVTNATNAANVATTATTTNASFFPVFVASATNGNQAINLKASAYTFNPNTVTLSCTNFAGALTGNASTVTTNANLTGPITSSGNATAIASQTGTGTKFVMDTGPTLSNPILGAAAATSVAFTNGQTVTTQAGAQTVGAATLSIPDLAGVNQNILTSAAALCQFDTYNANTITSVTGDGTIYTYVPDTAYINTNTVISLSTGLFTAPVTGLYFFSGKITVNNVVAVTLLNIRFLTAGSKAAAYGGFINIPSPTATNTTTFGPCALIYLIANDTVALQAVLTGTTKTIDIGGNSRFSGTLLRV